MNSRTQGAIGVGRAIAYYSAKGWAVFTPVVDMSRYDLIIDNGDRLLRVEVKTTTREKGQVNLRTMGGNQSWNGVVKRISSSDCDIVFAVNLITGTEREYPVAELEGKSSISVR